MIIFLAETEIPALVISLIVVFLENISGHSILQQKILNIR